MSVKSEDTDLSIRLGREAVQPGTAQVAAGARWGDVDRATEQFQTVLKKNPRSAEARNWLGVAYVQKADYSSAIAEFRQAIEINPNYARAHNNLASALDKDPGLRDVAGHVEDSGEGRWTVLTAIDQDVPAPITALSLFARFASRQDESFAAKVIAALRHEFGGHAVKGSEE